MKITMTLTFKLVEGEPVEDSDYVLDAFAAAVGRQNTAKHPLRVTVGAEDEAHSVYEVDLVDAP